MRATAGPRAQTAQGSRAARSPRRSDTRGRLPLTAALPALHQATVLASGVSLPPAPPPPFTLHLPTAFHPRKDKPQPCPAPHPSRPPLPCAAESRASGCSGLSPGQPGCSSEPTPQVSLQAAAQAAPSHPLGMPRAPAAAPGHHTLWPLPPAGLQCTCPAHCGSGHTPSQAAAPSILDRQVPRWPPGAGAEVRH